LIELLKICRENEKLQPTERCEDPLFETLKSPATIKLLLDNILKKSDSSYCESLVMNGSLFLIQYFIRQFTENDASGKEIKRKTMLLPSLEGEAFFTDQGSNCDDSSEAYLDECSAEVISRFEDFTFILKHSETIPEGSTNPSLGMMRLSRIFKLNMVSFYYDGIFQRLPE
jgi:hypothetical protein